LSVQRAVGAERNAVLGQDIAGKEIARLVLAISISKMSLVEICLRLAGCGAKSRVVRAVVEETHTVIGVIGVAILLNIRRVDGGWQVSGGLEILNRWCVLALRIKLGVA
jgi:hypothetical protein